MELLRLRQKFQVEKLKARQRLNYLTWAIPEVNSRLATTSRAFSNNHKKNQFEFQQSQLKKDLKLAQDHRRPPAPQNQPKAKVLKKANKNIVTLQVFTKLFT